MSPERLDLDRMEKLLELLTRHGVGQFEYEDADVKLRLDMGRVTVAAAPAPVHVAAPAPVAAPAAAAPQDAPGHVISSPMVGTFYRAASPTAEPFVSLGDRVRKGQPLCIIEAMKLMNEIEADVDGVVVAILADDKQPVQFGQPLFHLKVG